ncbi:MAG: hypothetical protein ACXVCI_13700, partial [Bdellovibrionota bacterium]
HSSTCGKKTIYRLRLRTFGQLVHLSTRGTCGKKTIYRLRLRTFGQLVHLSTAKPQKDLAFS